MTQAMLFKKCLGFNDAKAFGSHKVDPRTGATELIDCLNVTTTPDGCLERIPALTPVLTHSTAVTNISAQKRFIYQDGIDVKEWDGTAITTIGAVMEGVVAHTSIDVRVSNDVAVYKSGSTGSVMTSTVMGNTSNIPLTSKTFAAMPAYSQAFTYNGLLYAVNAVEPRFLQYSEYGHFDVWNLGDAFIGHALPILQAGAIIAAPGLPGCLVATHSAGASVYVGTNPADFIMKFYPCEILNGTLYSGFIDKANAFGHVFLCADGVYLIGGDGALVNLTVDQTDNLGSLNNTYSCATVQDGKYLAFGDVCCVEYDFKTKTLLKRAPLGIVSATQWQGAVYYAAGTTVNTAKVSVDTPAALPASFTLPFSDLGAPGTKSLQCLYFTGTVSKNMTITAVDQTGKGWTVAVEDNLDTVSSYRIMVPRGVLGNHISFTVASTSGKFRIEELRAVLAGSKRSR